MSINPSASNWRDLLLAIGGPLAPHDNLSSYLHRVAERAGIHARVIKSIWYSEQRISNNTKQKLEKAAATYGFENIAASLDVLARQLSAKDAAGGGAYVSRMRQLADDIRRRADAGQMNGDAHD